MADEPPPWVVHVGDSLYGNAEPLEIKMEPSTILALNTLDHDAWSAFLAIIQYVSENPGQ